MRRVWGLALVWMGLVFLNLNVHGVHGSYKNGPASEDEIMETSGHHDAFQDGQLAGVLGGLLQQRPDTVMRSMSTMGDPDRILCLFNKDSKGGKHNGHGSQKGGGDNGHGYQQHQQINNQQQYGVQQQHQQQSNNQAYGFQQQQQQQDPNQGYGVPQQNQNQMYGSSFPQSQENQAYGVSQDQAQAYGPPQNQNQYGVSPSMPQNQYGPQHPPHKQNKPPPQKSYSFSISFGDRLRPRKRPRHQKGLHRPHPHPPTPSIEMQPVPPPSQQYASDIQQQQNQFQNQFQQNQQPMYYAPPPQLQPEQSLSFQPQYHPQHQHQYNQQIVNLPLPPTNVQPLLPPSFQSPPQPQPHYQPVPQPQPQPIQPPPVTTNYFPQNTFTPSPQINSHYGGNYNIPVTQPQLNYFNPLDQLNYKPVPEPQSGYQDNQAVNYNQGDQRSYDKNFVYVYGPPENEIFERNPAPIVTRLPQSPEKRVQIVFIKAPAPPPPPQMELHLSPEPEHKTLVYVLVKKPSPVSDIKFTKPPPKTHSPPEVYFIKYKNNGGSSERLPSTSDPNADSYATIASTNSLQDENEQNFRDQGSEDVSEGSYGQNFHSRSNLPSTSSEFAMDMAESRSSFEQSSDSHYTAPGSLPWTGDAEE